MNFFKKLFSKNEPEKTEDSPPNIINLLGSPQEEPESVIDHSESTEPEPMPEQKTELENRIDFEKSKNKYT